MNINIYTVNIIIIIIAPVAERIAINELFSSMITTNEAMHKAAILKYEAASIRLNFLIKQGLNFKLQKPRKIIDPNSMLSYKNTGNVVPEKLLKKLSIPEINNLN